MLWRTQKISQSQSIKAKHTYRRKREKKELMRQATRTRVCVLNCQKNVRMYILYVWCACVQILDKQNMNIFTDLIAGQQIHTEGIKAYKDAKRRDGWIKSRRKTVIQRTAKKTVFQCTGQSMAHCKQQMKTESADVQSSATVE